MGMFKIMIFNAKFVFFILQLTIHIHFQKRSLQLHLQCTIIVIYCFYDVID